MKLPTRITAALRPGAASPEREEVALAKDIVAARKRSHVTLARLNRAIDTFKVSTATQQAMVRSYRDADAALARKPAKSPLAKPEDMP